MRRLPQAALVLALAAIASAAAATVWQTIDGEAASINGNTLTDNGWTYQLEYQSNGTKPALSTAQAYAGSSSLFMRISPDTDGQKERSEIRITQGTPFGSERWLSFALYIPTNFQAHPVDRWLMLAQVWQYSPASPPIALEFQPNTSNNLQLIVRNNDTGTSAPNIVKTGIAINKGAWNTVQLGFRLSTANTGFVSVYVNGQLVHTYNGKVGYIENQSYVTPKLGLYGSNSSALHEIWVDNVRYGSSRAETTP
ncbi:heparin lyase I family protein [Brevundimonas aurifodinae]|uniref:Heparin lyase I family protein n=1 Tax=Brevundimonas aurifodinae TaxID=1508312 RepID=A0ABV1NND5_9CAUL